ncbi:transposase [Streptomyces sp. NPDC006356]
MTVASMPQPTLPAQPVPAPAEEAEDVILGVDTHKDVHVSAVITALGASLAQQEFPATAIGYRQLLTRTKSFGVLRRAGVECTGSFGAALTRVLRREGIDVIEVNQPDRATRRKRGKTDAIDADAAARAVPSGRATTVPKSADVRVEDIRVLRLAKESAVKACTQALNQLKAVLMSIDPDLRELLTGLSNPALVATCAALNADYRGEAAFTMRLLARRVQHLSDEVKELTRRTTRAVRACRPQMLDLVGVGPDSAAVLHHRRR